MASYPTVCIVEGCEIPRKKRDFCHKHYSRWKRHGDPLKTKRATSNPGMTPEFKRKFVREYKLNNGCVDCGYSGHHAALDFDHRPGTSKVRDIKSGQQLGWKALLEEISKCDVVCANCHRIRTYVRREVMSYEYVV